MTYRIRRPRRASPRPSTTITLAEIRRAAATGIYDIRGGGAKRKLPHFDDLLFLGASISRYPLEGYREKCGTDVVLGTRFAKKPIHLKIPITIAGMSFGSLSAQAKEALGRGATLAGTSTTTGDGGMTEEERGHSQTLVYQYLPSRYGMNPDDLRRPTRSRSWSARAPSPAAAACCSARRSPTASPRCAPCRRASTSARPAVIPTGPARTISRSRSSNCARSPTGKSRSTSRSARSRPYYDTALAVKAGADVVVLDGMQGGTAATQEVFIENVGMPILACIRPAVQALQDLGMHRKVQLIVSGGIRNGADVAKALALGADAVVDRHGGAGRARRQRSGAGGGISASSAPRPAPMTTGTRAAIRPASPRRTRSCRRGSIRIAPGGGSPTISRCMTLEAQTIARACGKSHVHNLEPEDLVRADHRGGRHGAVPLAGTDWIPGKVSVYDPSKQASDMAVDGHTDLTLLAKERGIKYFLISYTDLFGAQRAKLVPAAAIGDMQRTAPASPASPPGST